MSLKSASQRLPLQIQQTRREWLLTRKKELKYPCGGRTMMIRRRTTTITLPCPRNATNPPANKSTKRQKHQSALIEVLVQSLELMRWRMRKKEPQTMMMDLRWSQRRIQWWTRRIGQCLGGDGQFINPVPFTREAKHFGVKLEKDDLEKIQDKNGSIRFHLVFDWLLPMFNVADSFNEDGFYKFVAARRMGSSFISIGSRCPYHSSCWSFSCHSGTTRKDGAPR
jgi:hypothetical protein